jgi:hypothetical protein
MFKIGELKKATQIAYIVIIIDLQGIREKL